MPAANAETVPAVQTFGSCVKGRRAGDILILFDKSGSIAKNDAGEARIVAAKELVLQLSADAQRNDTDLQLRVAGFSHAYEPAGDWISLKEPGAAKVLEGPIDNATATNAFESDYWAGLDGAQQDLQSRVGGKKGRCQALLWFTDGQFNLRPRESEEQLNKFGREKPYASGVPLTDETNVKKAEAAGKADLCRSTGPANQLRASGVSLLGIGLGADKINFTLMQQITENANRSCGSLQQPPAKFWQVENFDEVLEAFDEVAHPTAINTRKFVLDDLLTSVHAFARVPSPGLTYALKAPSGHQVTLKRDDTEGRFGSTTARWQWRGEGVLVIDLERGSKGDWAGLWEIVITDKGGDPAGDNPRVSFSADLYPGWPTSNVSALVGGGPALVRLGLTRADGRELPASDVPGKVTVSGRLIDSAGGTTNVPTMASKEQLSRTVSLDLTKAAPGPAAVRLRLTYETASVGGVSTKLEAQDKDVDVIVQPPPDRGALSTEPLDFGAVEGPADTTATISVTGPSCVWMNPEATVLGSPPGVEPVFSSEHNSPESCLRIGRGATALLPVHLSTTAEGNGKLQGTLPLQLAPEAAPDRAVVQPVSFTATMTKAVNPPLAILAFLIALVTGVGIPLAGLYLAKYLTAKIPGRALEAVRVPLTVTGDEVRQRDGRALTPDTLPRSVPVDVLRKGSRQVAAAGVDLRTRTGASPFSAGWVEATLGSSQGVSSTSDQPSGTKGAARLPIAVHNTWALFHDPAGPAEEATLLLLRGLDLTDAERRDLVNQAVQRAPGLLRKLRSAAPEGPAGPKHGSAATGPNASEPGTWSVSSFGGSAPGAGSGSEGAGWSTPPIAEPTPPPHDPAQSATTTPPNDKGQGPIDWTSGGFGAPPPGPDDPPRRS